MAYKDMFTILVVDSRIERSQSLRDAFDRIVGHPRDDHHLRTDVLGTTRDAVMRLRSDASVACLLLEWGGKGGASIADWPGPNRRPAGGASERAII